MARWYGILAGLGVCLSTWAVMTYVSVQIGLCLGLFLVTFWVVAMTSGQRQPMAARHTALTTSSTSIEAMVSHIKNMLEAHLKALPQTAMPAEHLAVRFEYTAGDLDTLIELVDQILQDPARVAPGEQSR